MMTNQLCDTNVTTINSDATEPIKNMYCPTEVDCKPAKERKVKRIKNRVWSMFQLKQQLPQLRELKRVKYFTSTGRVIIRGAGGALVLINAPKLESYNISAIRSFLKECGIAMDKKNLTTSQGNDLSGATWVYENLC